MDSPADQAQKNFLSKLSYVVARIRRALKNACIVIAVLLLCLIQALLRVTWHHAHHKTAIVIILSVMLLSAFLFSKWQYYDTLLGAIQNAKPNPTSLLQIIGAYNATQPNISQDYDFNEIKDRIAKKILEKGWLQLQAQQSPYIGTTYASGSTTETQRYHSPTRLMIPNESSPPTHSAHTTENLTVLLHNEPSSSDNASHNVSKYSSQTLLHTKQLIESDYPDYRFQLEEREAFMAATAASLLFRIPHTLINRLSLYLLTIPVGLVGVGGALVWYGVAGKVLGPALIVVGAVLILVAAAVVAALKSIVQVTLRKIIDRLVAFIKAAVPQKVEAGLLQAAEAAIDKAQQQIDAKQSHAEQEKLAC